MCKRAFVYLLASRPGGTLYVGVTSDLARRVYEHKRHLVEGFTAQYGVTRLVWFIEGASIVDAISLEKKIKNRSRRWKIDLIERENPEWRDLAADWFS
ncbi:GIY-YIG nuclease family protein [Leucobacter sp.]